VMGGEVGGCYSTPASLRAFCKIVSFTAAKTRRMLLVSVACVKLLLALYHWEYRGIGRSTVDKPSCRIVVSFVRIGRGCTSLLFRGQDHLRSKLITCTFVYRGVYTFVIWIISFQWYGQ